MSKILIALAGRKRTGKETVYKLMYSYLNRPAEFQFATPLKKFCIDVLGLTWEQCYGPDAARESPTQYRWGWVNKDIREFYKKQSDDVMTARDVLQVVGTDLMREQFYKDIWAEAGVRAAINSDAISCIFSDTRFTNEIRAIREMSSKLNYHKPLIIRLYRETQLIDSHKSECALDVHDVVSNQRRIADDMKDILEMTGYQKITPTLWKGGKCSFSDHSYYDYLIDNNFTVESLRENITLILKETGLYQEPSLS